MDKMNATKLWSEIIKAGDFLKDKLPEHPNHPKGRNSYAHVALEIKNKFNLSYKDIHAKIKHQMILILQMHTNYHSNVQISQNHLYFHQPKYN